jgi:hypothetical protein
MLSLFRSRKGDVRCALPGVPQTDIGQVVIRPLTTQQDREKRIGLDDGVQLAASRACLHDRQSLAQPRGIPTRPRCRRSVFDPEVVA